MKNRRKIIAAILITATFLFLNCDGEEKKSIQQNKSKNETERLKEIKLKKQSEADSLKKEIEMLKQKRDSLGKALENETQN